MGEHIVRKAARRRNQNEAVHRDPSAPQALPGAISRAMRSRSILPNGRVGVPGIDSPEGAVEQALHLLRRVVARTFDSFSRPGHNHGIHARRTSLDQASFSPLPLTRCAIFVTDVDLDAGESIPVAIERRMNVGFD